MSEKRRCTSGWQTGVAPISATAVPVNIGGPMAHSRGIGYAVAAVHSCRRLTVADDIPKILRGFDVGRIDTHYENCWKVHPICALHLAADVIHGQKEKIEDMMALMEQDSCEIERLRAELADWTDDEWNAMHEGCPPAVRRRWPPWLIHCFDRPQFTVSPNGQKEKIEDMMALMEQDSCEIERLRAENAVLKQAAGEEGGANRMTMLYEGALARIERLETAGDVLDLAIRGYVGTSIDKALDVWHDARHEQR
jgi:hypothetical protein